VQDTAPVVMDHEKAVQHVQRGRRDREQVHAGNCVLVVTEERDPPLEEIGVGFVLAEASYVTGHGSLGYREAELLEFTQDPRGTPMVLSNHLANEITDFGLDSRTTGTNALL